MLVKKIILITGASSGIGKATAKQLLSEGHIVYGASRKAKEMSDFNEDNFHAISMDVTKYDQIEKGVNQIIKEQGKIDVLFNNAGYGLYGTVEEISIDQAKYQFDVNLFGLARLTQLILPHMRKQKFGMIVNTSSIGGKMYTPFGAWYHATKHALEGWSDCLRLETKEFGIKVVIIEPGAIKTGFGDVLYDPMLNISGNGPYKNLVQKVAKSYKARMGDKGSGSDPSVIAKTVSKAINSKNPKTRYAAGSMAKLILFIRKWFSDKIFDKVIMSQI
ncbi:oxidoreductase [archaeon]|nr:oxidoreductase [archaeon]MBT4022290.1 oxidoreductase [archaeon]MBT4271753.1 oxidoreductase [archaeon]MBT4461397.1 oxidoreductase [archaeon]MBT4858653.1 oxidoreductase [archaeon]